MKIIVFILFGIYIFSLSSYSQCDSLLYDDYMKEIDSNAIILKTFNVQLDKMDESGLTPFAKFPTNFEIGKKYEFIVVWDTVNYNSKAILQHYYSKKDRIIATNYQMNKNIIHHSFYFQNPSVEKSEIWVNFEHGNAGCAVVVITEIKDKIE